METTIYLAMTAAEYMAAQTLPAHPAWMACHFSAYSTGLSNCPAYLPPHSVVMVNDRTPIWRHDPARILTQLKQMTEDFSLAGVVLDFQRPDHWETEQLTGILVTELGCSVAVSETYAGKFECPVFLSTPPLHTPLKEYLQSWDGREIWLEAVLCEETLTVTKDGCRQEEKLELSPQQLPFLDENLICRYGFKADTNQAMFTLRREKQELDMLLHRAAEMGITKAIGLYQQLQ